MRAVRNVGHRARFVRDNFIGLGVLVLAVILVVVLFAGCGTAATGTTTGAASTNAAATATGSTAPVTPDGLGTISYDALPSQAKQTLALIAKGGPFPYPRNDGVVYHNYNKVLPTEPDGYYREYTVPTPGLSNRGPRRIIKGSGGQLYYTADHYNTFKRIVT